MTSYYQQLTSAKIELPMTKWIGKNYHRATEEGSKGQGKEREKKRGFC